MSSARRHSPREDDVAEPEKRKIPAGGEILLAGLFVYDVWWVFGSQHVFGDNVMVEVATSFDG
jgi:hypothetical protein